MPDHAVVIGINSYPGMRNLLGPCQDAEEFLTWVTRPGPGDVEPGNVHKLLSTDFPPETDFREAQPVCDQIINMFEEILDGNPVKDGIGNRLYVFVAGHGMSDINRPESAALIAANASTHSISVPHVVVTDYVHYFRRIYAFKEIILVMDCCLDAVVQRSLDVKGFLQGPPHPKASQVKMFLAKATVWSKRSYEKEFNGVVRGIFSVALMEALANAPARENRVTGKAVKEYIDQNIKRIAGNQAIEEPTINGRKYDEIIFCQRPAAAPHRAPRKFTLTVKADGAADGAEVTLFDGNLVLAETKPVINRTAVFQVTPGMYKVALPGTDRKSLLEIVGDHEEIL